MTLKPPSTDPTADQMHNALARLDAAMAEVDDLQRRFDQMSSRMDALLQKLVRAPSANLGAKLRSLEIRSEGLRKGLDRARRAYATARKGYKHASDAYWIEHRQAAADAISLQTERADAERCKSALDRAINELASHLAKDLPAEPVDTDGQRSAKQPGSFRDVPIRVAHLFDRLIVLERLLASDPDYTDKTQRHRPVSFLDVGCGTGRNLILARASGLLRFDALTGFDINAARIKRGRDMFDLGKDLLIADPLTFDYGDYDVVFSFPPFHDMDLMTKYETRLVTTLRSSAYLIAVMPVDLARFPDLDCVDQAQGIWKKTG